MSALTNSTSPSVTVVTCSACDRATTVSTSTSVTMSSAPKTINGIVIGTIKETPYYEGQTIQVIMTERGWEVLQHSEVAPSPSFSSSSSSPSSSSTKAVALVGEKIISCDAGDGQMADYVIRNGKWLQVGSGSLW